MQNDTVQLQMEINEAKPRYLNGGLLVEIALSVSLLIFAYFLDLSVW